MLSKDEFEDALVGFGFKPMRQYSKRGRIQWWVKPDGQLVTVVVWDKYPTWYLESVLDEHNIGRIPIYTSNT